MDFICRCCKKRITRTDPHRLIEKADLHEDAYHFEWALFDEEEMSKPINERVWSERNIQPLVGDKRILRVKAPFDEKPGDTFTNFYEPWQMFYNGWDNAEKPEDIYKACGVLCRFDEVLWADDYSAFIVVEILNVVPVGDLCRVLPEEVTDRDFMKEFGYGDETEVYYQDEHLLCRSWEDFHSGSYLLSNYVMG